MDSDSKKTAIAAVESLLHALGTKTELDPQVGDTPERFVDLLIDRFIPRERSRLKPLPAEAGECGPIIVRDIAFHALCAHHIVPFFGVVHVAYIPSGSIAGFGAFPRLVDELSRGPQLQERLASQIADAVHEDLAPLGVFIAVEARQMCMELTGSCSHSNTVVYAARGIYAERDTVSLPSKVFGAVGL